MPLCCRICNQQKVWFLMSLMLSVGARVRKSPFFAATRKAGLAAASVYNHMFLPTSYGDPAAEYDRLVNGVAMWDVAVERQVALKGPDARKLARLLTPRNPRHHGPRMSGSGEWSPSMGHPARRSRWSAGTGPLFRRTSGHSFPTSCPFRSLRHGCTAAR